MADPEKSGPPPAYDSPPAYSPPPTIPVAAQVAAVPMAAPAAAEQRHTAIPIFITARTNVYGVNPVEMDCPHCNVSSFYYYKIIYVRKSQYSHSLDQL